MKTDCKNQCFFVVSAWESVHCLALKSVPFYNRVSNKDGVRTYKSAYWL